MIIDQKPPLDEALLIHFGVKGMKWGVVNNNEIGKHRFQTVAPVIDSGLPRSTKTAGKEVASLIGERYNFHISAIKAIKPGDEEYEIGTVGYVEHTPGKQGGVIYARQADISKSLEHCEHVGWAAEGCGTTKAFLTHESAHAIFHAEQQVKTGLFKSKLVGGNIEAREVALKAAIKQAQRDGISVSLFSTKVSGYAATSGTREELEAELFSQYHWSPNPPPFVRAWGETLHQEMGLDATPFRESVKRG